MNYETVLKELDDLVFEEYKSTRLFLSPLFEKDDDDEASTPLRRIGSFPARAIRYRKAKNVLTKYVTKILNRSDRIITRFEEELNKSIPQIEKKGNDLQGQLERAKRMEDDVEARSIVNQQKKFKNEVDKNQELRFQNLNQSIENLINTYTTAIHKRIDDPGYVLKVELSEKGKADLKFLWDENIAIARQEIYEKLIKILNNKHIKGLESLISRLEVEVEEAEDNRIKSRRARYKTKSAEEKGGSIDSPAEESEYDDELSKQDEISDETTDEPAEAEREEYENIKNYLEDNLPGGFQKEGEFYYHQSDIKKKPTHVYVNYDDIDNKVIAEFFELDGEGNKKSDNPSYEEEILDISEAEDFVEGVSTGEEYMDDQKSDVENKAKFDRYYDTLIRHLDTFFNTKESYIKKGLGYSFYETYQKMSKIKALSKYMVGEILDNPEKYTLQEKYLKAGNIPGNHMITNFIKVFLNGFEEEEKERSRAQKKTDKNESFVSLDNYKKTKSI